MAKSSVARTVGVGANGMNAIKSDAQDPVWNKLNEDVINDPDNFEGWESLIQASENQEGGLNKHSNPNALFRMRSAYDRFLARFPLLFGYWTKYADLEFTISGSESADIIYERAVASVPTSVDLWTTYCSFKMDTHHDEEEIRSYFERAVNAVGLDFMSHPIWDKYIEYETRLERPDNIIKLLDRLIRIPLYQYSKYFEHYTTLGATRPINELITPDLLQVIKSEIPENVQGEELETLVRQKIHARHLEIFTQTQTNVTRRWPFEAKIKRSYFHVAPLDEEQLINWRQYLDFEEVEGDVQRVRFLYERCLVPTAFYDEFWFRYVRWLSSLPNTDESYENSYNPEEIKNIYRRASTLFVPIGRPAIRFNWAIFEETEGDLSIALSIYDSILVALPESVEAIIQKANFIYRVTQSPDEAANVYKAAIESDVTRLPTKGALTAEMAYFLYHTKADTKVPRSIFQSTASWYLDSSYFWIKYLRFELGIMPNNKEELENKRALVAGVHFDIRTKARLPPHILKDLSHLYMEFLLECGNSDSMKEYLLLDREVNGQFFVQNQHKRKIAPDNNVNTTNKRLKLENGHPGIIDEAAAARGEDPLKNLDSLSHNINHYGEGHTSSSSAQPSLPIENAPNKPSMT